MKIIKSTNNYSIFVDDNKFDYLKQFKWSVIETLDGHLYARNSSLKQFMHRLLLNVTNKNYVDHIDGNGLNNQLSNLRLSNNQLNQANSRKHKIGLSKYKGVSWSKDKKKWRAYISPNRKYIHLGYFKYEKDAAKAYNKAALKHFNQYAYLNEV